MTIQISNKENQTQTNVDRVENETRQRIVATNTVLSQSPSPQKNKRNDLRLKKKLVIELNILNYFESQMEDESIFKIKLATLKDRFVDDMSAFRFYYLIQCWQDKKLIQIENLATDNRGFLLTYEKSEKTIKYKKYLEGELNAYGTNQ